GERAEADAVERVFREHAQRGFPIFEAHVHGCTEALGEMRAGDAEYQNCDEYGNADDREPPERICALWKSQAHALRSEEPCAQGAGEDRTLRAGQSQSIEHGRKNDSEWYQTARVAKMFPTETNQQPDSHEQIPGERIRVVERAEGVVAVEAVEADFALQGF